MAEATRPDVFDAYRDHDGQPTMVPSAVLFVDVLGTRAASKAAEEQQNAYVRRLIGAIDAAQDAARFEAEKRSIATTYFTDNIACAAPFIDYGQTDRAMSNLIYMAGLYQATMTCEGVLTRGGLAVGNHYMDAKNAFGDAIVDAVETEHATSFPRIALSHVAIALAWKFDLQYSERAGPFKRNLLVDPDGTVFVNVLAAVSEDASPEVEHETLRRHAASVNQILVETTKAPHAVREKVFWLASYHNWFATDRYPENPELLIDPAPTTRTFIRFDRSIGSRFQLSGG